MDVPVTVIPQEQQLEIYSGKILLKVLGKRIIRKMKWFFGADYTDISTTSYNGLVVFSTPYLDGGGTTFGQGYLRSLLELGLKRCDNVYEFCAGPGYIGYSLFANGFCKNLTLSDINPRSVEMARMTARYNHIEDHVNVYLSDSLDDIPESEKWDLAVGNPPFFLPPSRGHLPKKPDETMKLPRKTVVTESINLRTYDPDWSIHKKFYAKIKRHMKPGGLVVMQECQRGSDADVFKPMIADGGGRFIRSFAAEDLYGKKNAIYYVVSQW